jgi:hypothetical protein
MSRLISHQRMVPVSESSFEERKRVSRVYDVVRGGSALPETGRFRLYLTGGVSARLVQLALGIIIAVATGRGIITNGIPGLDILTRYMDYHHGLSASIEEVSPIPSSQARTCEELACLFERDHLSVEGYPGGELGASVGAIVTSLLYPTGECTLAVEEGVDGPADGVRIGDTLHDLGYLLICDRFIGSSSSLGYVGRAIRRARGGS